MSSKLNITPGIDEALVPGYTDVTINRNTCLITKYYSDKPTIYFYNGKTIYVNLYYLVEKPRLNSSRQVSILTTYKKVFGSEFSGTIDCNGGALKGVRTIINNKIY